MQILAMDTARGHGSVALWRDGSVHDFAELGVAPGFGEVLFIAVDRLLSRSGTRLDEVDGFAAATGPGSFTGIRVGLVAAKAFSEGSGKPLAGISSLRALASAAAVEGHRVALLDARRGEVFAGCFDAAGEPVSPEMVGAWSEIGPRLNERGLPLVANEPLFGEGGPAAEAASLTRHRGPPSLAREIARIAALDIAGGRGSRPEEVEANYIRRPAATPPRWARAASRP